MQNLLSFASFMQEWLYGSGVLLKKEGYYKKARVGKGGDFYTNVSVGRFFGYCLGFYLAELLESKAVQGKVAIVEIGAEKGDLIADIAEFFTLFFADIQCDFLTLEPFKSLQILQKENFLNRVNASLDCVSNFDDLRNKAYDVALFVSNELLDAFACELVYKDLMAYVTHVDGVFALEFKNANKEVLKIAKAFDVEVGEIPLNAFGFAKEVASVAKQWLFLGFDYGALQGRNAFSMRIYTQHTTQNLFVQDMQYNKEILNAFGEVDLTYDVNFALWREAFLQNGAREVFLKHQNRALVDMGLDKMCSLYIAHFGLESYMQQSAKLRTLISPGSFGERFFGCCFANFKV